MKPFQDPRPAQGWTPFAMMRRRRCADPTCDARAGHIRCQDCHKAFCGAHVGGVEFSGPRHDRATATTWTRFVCDGCAARTNRIVLDSATRIAREHVVRDAQGHWWTEQRP